ncbi:MAG TPA: alpha-1,4-glucan--maltose-1-phosphate maltosyltransferase [Kofleriaceae bacterium]|nr:alpha-1,4-glucan--maltose-1-phosphate maltosyltransferase [Kofleriaceae bacterium]
MRRVLVEGVWPEIDAGAYPVKRILGDDFTAAADLIADGHDLLAGALLYRHEQDDAWREVRLTAAGNDRWQASFALDRLGLWRYAIEGWVDHAATWLRVLRIKSDAGEQSAADLPIELVVGSRLCAAAASRAAVASPSDAVRLRDAARDMARAELPVRERVALALEPGLAQILSRWPDRARAARYPRELAVSVDRPRAQYSTWYELFPRSCGAAGQHGTFRDAEARLPHVADMGFDVLYLPPIHPIGRTFRKGKNNTLDPGPDDVGSPWAIGAAEGGHTAVHPQLGTLADFRHFVAAAAALGVEVALDIAFQASPDHPWVTEHPAWFKHRPDGTIQYAENPPKKYQDIYPIDFESSDWRALWDELLSVFTYWIDQGVKIFRVDNPHTKSLHFWGWCIGEIKARHPDVIFLAEAFTAPKRMYALAKLGFSQSYTYFTWRESAWDLETYMRELTTPPVVEFFRPNFWPNTPDILPDHLVDRGRGAFAARLVLAATLTASYGMYGPAFELMDNRLRPGSGEYLDNEKYELKQWDVGRAGSLRPLIRRINRIRRANPALHADRLLRFHRSENPSILCYSKRTEDRSNVILTAVNLDSSRQGGFVHLDLAELGLTTDQPFRVRDLIGGGRYAWRGSRNYVELDPYSMPAHVFIIERT